MKKAITPKKQVFTKLEKEFIEKCAIIYEKGQGFPRIAGKIFGYLLISKPPEQKISDIQKGIGASKASMSNMIRVLESAHMIEEVSILGERSAFYKVKPISEENALDGVVGNFLILKGLMEFGCKATQHQHAYCQKRVKEWLSFYTFLSEKLPIIFQEWAKNKEKYVKHK